MIRLEAPAQPCPTPGCNGRCGYVQLDLIELSDYVKPRTLAELFIGNQHPILQTPKFRAVVSDERPTDVLTRAHALADGSIETFAEDPCSAWKAFIRALYFTGYRWFWFEEDEGTPENEVKTP